MHLIARFHRRAVSPHSKPSPLSWEQRLAIWHSKYLRQAVSIWEVVFRRVSYLSSKLRASWLLSSIKGVSLICSMIFLYMLLLIPGLLYWALPVTVSLILRSDAL